MHQKVRANVSGALNLHFACVLTASPLLAADPKRNVGDKIMEEDYHVGQILDTLKGLGIDGDTIVIFAALEGISEIHPL